MLSIMLFMHIAAAATGLALAGPILLAPKRRGVHTMLGRVYIGALIIMCLTALVLVFDRPAVLWPLGIIAVVVLGLALGGLWLALRRPRGWFIWHLNLMSSSAIAFITAFAVQLTDLDNVYAWVVPSVIGSPLIAYRTMVAMGAIKPLHRISYRQPAR